MNNILLEEISPRKQYERTIQVNHKKYTYISLDSLNLESITSKLPYCIRVILENVLRHSSDHNIQAADIKNILNWKYTQNENKIIPFKPARIIMNDLRGTPAIMELVTVNDYAKNNGWDNIFREIKCPTTIVICQSLETEHYGSLEALLKNQEADFQKYKDRYRFIKWAGKTFSNLSVIPPNCGSINHINVEYLSQTVQGTKSDFLYPDSVIGIGCQSATVGALGLLGFDVSTSEAQLAMFDEPIYFKLPGVVGLYLKGQLKPLVTSTDVAIYIAALLRQGSPQGKIIEIFGPALSLLPVDYRISIASMCTYIGALSVYFPTDTMTLTYMERIGKPKHLIDCIRTYTRINRLGILDKDKGDTPGDDPEYSERLEIDLSQINTSVAGPAHPAEQQTIDMTKSRFIDLLVREWQKRNLTIESLETKVSIEYENTEINLKHGDIIMAAIEGTLSTCNAYEMIGFGLMARSAVSAGLRINPYIKLLFTPGSPSVVSYLEQSDLLRFIYQLGFYTVGFSSFSTYQSDDNFPDCISKALVSGDVMTVAVISGQEYWVPDGHGYGERNRSCKLISSTYVMSPQLVLAFALAGTICTDLDVMPLGKNVKGFDVYLRDLWPSKSQIKEIVDSVVKSTVYIDSVNKWQSADFSPNRWNILRTNDYILNHDGINGGFFHPYWQLFSETNFPRDIFNARVLLYLGDNVTTDKIVASGKITRSSRAGEYLHTMDIKPKQFYTYESRIANSEVLSRGTFAAGNLLNKLLPKRNPDYCINQGDNFTINNFSGLDTLHFPQKDVVNVYDCARKYRADGVPVIIIAGHNFGLFTSEPKDWCAKGLLTLGVRAVIAQSYYQSNGRALNKELAYVGILPLQFIGDQNLQTLGLSGHEAFSLRITGELKPLSRIAVEVDDSRQQFDVIFRIDTEQEMAYFKCGGVLNFLARNHAKSINC